MGVETLAGKARSTIFVRKLRAAKLAEFEDDFCKVLESVRDATSLISKETGARDVHGLSSSLR